MEKKKGFKINGKWIVYIVTVTSCNNWMHSIHKNNYRIENRYLFFIYANIVSLSSYNFSCDNVHACKLVGTKLLENKVIEKSGKKEETIYEMK
jgi:hypothetical protein